MVLANEGNRPKTAKLTQKVVHSENSRLNSCLYPNAVITLSSASMAWSVYGTSPFGKTEVTGAGSMLEYTDAFAWAPSDGRLLSMMNMLGEAGPSFVLAQ